MALIRSLLMSLKSSSAYESTLSNQLAGFSFLIQCITAYTTTNRMNEIEIYSPYFYVSISTTKDNVDEELVAVVEIINILLYIKGSIRMYIKLHCYLFLFFFDESGKRVHVFLPHPNEKLSHLFGIQPESKEGVYNQWKRSILQ